MKRMRNPDGSFIKSGMKFVNGVENKCPNKGTYNEMNFGEFSSKIRLDQ